MHRNLRLWSFEPKINRFPGHLASGTFLCQVWWSSLKRFSRYRAYKQTDRQTNKRRWKPYPRVSLAYYRISMTLEWVVTISSKFNYSIEDKRFMVCSGLSVTLTGYMKTICLSGKQFCEQVLLFKQDVALKGRNRTGPPCSVGRPTAHAPAAGRPARRQRNRRWRDRRRQTPASKTVLAH